VIREESAGAITRNIGCPPTAARGLFLRVRSPALNASAEATPTGVFH
jgi:hypothetical protein